MKIQCSRESGEYELNPFVCRDARNCFSQGARTHVDLINSISRLKWELVRDLFVLMLVESRCN